MQPENNPQGSRLPKNFRYPKVTDLSDANIIKMKQRFIKLIADEFLEVEKPLVITPELKPKLAFCFNWVIGTSINWKENKGLQLFGEVGTGKSCIMKAVVKFCNELYSQSGLSAKYITANKIASFYRSTDP